VWPNENEEKDISGLIAQLFVAKAHYSEAEGEEGCRNNEKDRQQQQCAKDRVTQSTLYRRSHRQMPSNRFIAEPF
jgi:hypothetical protein